MASLSLGTFIRAPKEEVFAAFSAVDRWAELVEGIVRVERETDGPVGNGTRFKETRVMFKKEHTEEMWIEDFDPPNGYSVNADSCGSRFTSAFRFSEKDGGTQVDMETRTKAVSFMAKVMTPLGFLMMGPMKKMMAKDFEDLKTALEARAQQPA